MFLTESLRLGFFRGIQHARTSAFTGRKSHDKVIELFRFTVHITGSTDLSFPRASIKADYKQALHKSVEWPAFLRQSCFVMPMNERTEGGVGREEKTLSFPGSFYSFAWHNTTVSEKRAARLIYEGTARRFWIVVLDLSTPWNDLYFSCINAVLLATNFHYFFPSGNRLHEFHSNIVHIFQVQATWNSGEMTGTRSYIFRWSRCPRHRLCISSLLFYTDCRDVYFSRKFGLSTELTMKIDHRTEIEKLTFRASALRQSEGLTLETLDLWRSVSPSPFALTKANARNVSFSISVRWSIYIINSVDKPKFRVSLPTDAAPQFL